MHRVTINFSTEQQA